VLYPEEEEAGLVELIIGFAPQASCPNVESEVLLLQDGPVVDHAMPWLCGGENRPAGRKPTGSAARDGRLACGLLLVSMSFAANRNESTDPLRHRGKHPHTIHAAKTCRVDFTRRYQPLFPPTPSISQSPKECGLTNDISSSCFFLIYFSSSTASPARKGAGLGFTEGPGARDVRSAFFSPDSILVR
jgi:hypothetical protein